MAWLKRFALPGALAALLAGCSTTGVLGALEPKGRVAITRGLAFGDDPRLKLDVYAPKGRTDAPVVVFFYGGSWNSGSRGLYTFLGSALASHGYVVVIPDYRIYPQVRWPAFVEDSALAVRWAADHAGQYGGDRTRLVLMGHSAGAYNAAMLTYDDRWLTAVGLDARRDIRAFVGLAGPYDFLPLHSEELKTIFGPEDGRPGTQPINYVDGNEALALLITAAGDTVVDPNNAKRMAARIREKGGPVETRRYTGVNHVTLIGAFALPLRRMAPALRDVTTFIDGVVGRQASSGPPPTSGDRRGPQRAGEAVRAGS